ncbi:MAG TPA: hydrogenase maturation protease [Candidatus Limnocylindrales bacterium]|nr:hydrogenase maturation protease [Candidatus Limnocylindrales bacterium]
MSIARAPLERGSSLVIAFGNPLRGDDAVAWRVADALILRRRSPDQEIITCSQLLPELAEKISRAAIVCFLDAACSGPPGEWSCITLEEACELPALGHSLSPAALLALSRSLYGEVPPAFLFTVSGASFDLGAGLSDRVAAAVPGVVSAIENQLLVCDLAFGLAEPSVR